MRAVAQSAGGMHPFPCANLSIGQSNGDLPAMRDELPRHRGRAATISLQRLDTEPEARGVIVTRSESLKMFAVNARPDPRHHRLSASVRERGAAWLVGGAVIGAITFGWFHRHDRWIDPHAGLGYALGIIGGLMMLILLAYPVRKRLRKPSRKIGSVGFWFRFHMLLGLFGPVAILYHARFTWGALNSAFAMGAMIVVASSGLIGRYFYSRVHRGYSDRKLEMRVLRREMDTLAQEIAHAGASTDVVDLYLVPFEERAVAAGADFWSSARALVGIGLATRRAEKALTRSLAGMGGADLRKLVAEFYEAVRRAAEFAFYDRLLRLWHLLHLPLFVVLVAAAVLHIIAVHMY